MRFSAIIHAMTFDGQDTLSLPEALTTLRECGFEGVMLMSVPGRPALTAGTVPDACLLDLPRSDLDAVRRVAVEAGMEVLGLYSSGIDPTREDALEDSGASLRAGCDVARELGCRHIGHPGGQAPSPGLAVEAKLAHIKRLARIVDAVAAEFGEMLFAVDAHYHGIVETVTDCERYVEELTTPRAGILLNTGHMTTCDQPGWELLGRHPERVPVVGWKDHRPDPDGSRPYLSVQLGTGDTPLGCYVGAARGQAIDRVHVINVEHAPMEDKAAALRASLEYMQALRDGT